MTRSSPLIPVTVLVQTKDEAGGISVCLKGLEDFDEVVVVDSLSTDGTQALAEAAGVRVVDFDWDGAYPKKKQWQLDNVETRHPWVLFIDADESPKPALVAELRAMFSAGVEPDVSAFDVSLDYVFAGRVLRYGHRVTKRSLVHRDRVRFPVMDDLGVPGMGELEGHYQPEPNGRVARLRGRIHHNDLDPIATWFSRHNKYSDWEAHLRNRPAVQSMVRRRRTFKGRFFDMVPFKPVAFFVYAYVARLGFLDGRAGLDYALALAMYYWQIGVKTRELSRADGKRVA